MGICEADLERLHRVNQERDRRWRQWWVFRSAVEGGDPRRQLANAVELQVMWRLEERGHLAVRQRHKAHFDLNVQGVRVEVKVSRWDGSRYEANLHNNEADVLGFGCLDGDVHFFVMPFEQAAGRTGIKVPCHDPRDYARWTMFYENWELVDELVRAGRNPWQLSLWGG